MKTERLFLNETMKAVGIEITNEGLESNEVGIIIVSPESSSSWTLTKREFRELLDAMKEYSGDKQANLSFGDI